MCGRYTLTRAAEVVERFQVSQTSLDEVAARYNVAPSQTMPVVHQDDGGKNRLEMYKWGLIPFWSKEAKATYSTINARAEGLAEKPAYRKPIRSQRCIVPADGFYEWQKSGTGKTPYFIHLKSSELFGFAGLYDIYRDKNGQEERTFTIVTTEANEMILPVHNRMPVILHREDEEEWLDASLKDPFQVMRLLKPYPAELIELYPVSKRVNSPGFDVPELLQTLNSA